MREKPRAASVPQGLQNPAKSEKLVHAALWERRSGDRVRVPVDLLAAETGLHERTVLRALRRLCDRGDLAFAGREGKSAVFRFAKNLAEQFGCHPPLRGGVTDQTDSRRAVAKVAGIDQPEGLTTPDHEPDWELTDEERERGLEGAYSIVTALNELPVPDVGPGHCGECGHYASRRYGLGAFCLCYRCRRRRALVAERFPLADLAEELMAAL